MRLILACFWLLVHGASAARTAASAEESEGPGPILLTSPETACCCKKGKCREGSKGVKGNAAVPYMEGNTTYCCKQRNGGWRQNCDKFGGYGENKDSSYCQPDRGTAPRVRLCRKSMMASHQFIEFGDGGCTSLLSADGSFVGEFEATEYAKRDCPFTEISSDPLAKARRALLYMFSTEKPASYSDVMHSCNTRPNQPQLDVSGDNWDSLRKEPLRSLLNGDSSAVDFLCKTLRLAPLMWERVAFGGNGIMHDLRPQHAGEKTYPISMNGVLKRPGKFDTYKCGGYSTFTERQSQYGRRVLRALLPTYAAHVFVQGGFEAKRDHLLKAVFGVKQMTPYTAQLKASCDFPSDSELVERPLAEMQNAEVLKRDENRCHKTFPCAYEFPNCVSAGTKGATPEQTCSCTCYTGICTYFASDFTLTMQATEEACRRALPTAS
eukprot:gb/GFBE01013589.1/.p1 GENE.gb/GFBE01013589.1/~~gb/GFBE01013589.1/.p1  ORF type:complete len:437 (+),score=74.99 gb/GFBE01013589.1/:1-1311(+)